ncbi:uncharacterized protein LOC116846538 [Odontomachus brunneus]|uniref:uncharacterized protein LOC116846538 n=1 Tax=Odontomachus brunneus TaxID=486640 RepID=UPI0013F18088|nr:uncharacterized protein LOC116846538 [Odontomachus brunneus]
MSEATRPPELRVLQFNGGIKTQDPVSVRGNVPSARLIDESSVLVDYTQELISLLRGYLIMSEYDMEDIHKYVKEKLLHEHFNETMNPTRMNVIVPIIPKPTRDIMDLTLLAVGVSLNVLFCLVILRNSFLRTTANCYIISLMCSNLLILIEPLQQVFYWLFDVYFTMNLDYVFLLTFDSSVLTIVQLNIEAYVVICHKSSPLHAPLLKIRTAVKGILFIWIMCIVLICTELKLYEHFEQEVMYDICVSSTFMFLVFPGFIFVMLDCFILYDLITMKSIDGTWSSIDIERFILLVNITVGFILFMIPYRVVRSVTLITSFCCSDLTIEIVYTLVKIYPIILPLTCLLISAKFRQAFKLTLSCQQREISVTT